MSLLVRVNLALVVVFALGATITGLACRSVLQRNAEREIHDDAELMMDGALAVRDYTASEVAPLLHAQMQSQFLPQSVPFYAATELFLRLHASRPDYSYQEATLNPTKPRDRATDWQADIIQRFRNDARASFPASVIRPWAARCILQNPFARAPNACPVTARRRRPHRRCSPAMAAATVSAGRQAGDVVGAQVVAVPIASAEARAGGAFRAFLVSLVAVFVTLLMVVNLVLYLLVVRPVRRMAQIADRLSVGDSSAPEFPAQGGEEIAALGRSFNRMRKSLDKALKLLET